MSTLQIKSLPEDLHEELKRRATQHGMTLRDYVLDLIRRDLALPTRHDWLDSLKKLKVVELDRPAADLLREIRDERETDDGHRR
jgi:plasmid stability protein